MKKIATALLLVSTLSTSLLAWEFDKNPDRFPSLGLNYTGTSDTGQYKVIGLSQDIESNAHTVVLDTRLPLSNSLTLAIGAGTTSSHSEGKGGGSFNADQLDQDGGLFTVGARYYFNH